jgi:hypothetical protein
MLNPINPRRDLRLSGHVIYTGRSSMEIAVKMESLASAEEGGDETVLIGVLPSSLRVCFTHIHPQADSRWYAATRAPTVRGRCILSCQPHQRRRGYSRLENVCRFLFRPPSQSPLI